MSPLVAARACLQSIIGRPVFSRSSLTMPAVTSAISGLPTNLSDGPQAAPLKSRKKIPTELTSRANRFQLLLFHFGDVGPAFDNRVGQVPNDQLDRPNAIVIAGNWQIDRVRVAVGVDQRNR